MNMLPVVTVAVLLLATLLVAAFKGSRPPQPIPSNPTTQVRGLGAGRLRCPFVRDLQNFWLIPESSSRTTGTVGHPDEGRMVCGRHRSVVCGSLFRIRGCSCSEQSVVGNRLFGSADMPALRFVSALCIDRRLWMPNHNRKWHNIPIALTIPHASI